VRQFQVSEIEKYLQTIAGPGTRLVRVKPLGGKEESGVKAFGYGTPLLLHYETAAGDGRRAVLHSVTPSRFGHDNMADRAQGLLWSHRSFNQLPRHVRSLDVGAVRESGSAVSLGDAEEFFLLTDYIDGALYAEDLHRLLKEPHLTGLDVSRAHALADYLVQIHAVRGGNPGLYLRRLRDLVGHTECIMGLIDTYPHDHPDVDAAALQQIERMCVEWRWRLKPRAHRMRQIHGDLHPWNILFSEGSEFGLLDRSRGEWGDPADDITSLSMNFLFFSLQRSGRLEGPFEILFREFWERYMAGSGDHEMLAVCAPYCAFRGLVMAHPVWYPQLTRHVRTKMFNFMDAVLHEETFDPGEVNRYCGA
jgi:aminoglycoside phosphotransferase (APT) family kinase protein